MVKKTLLLFLLLASSTFVFSQYVDFGIEGGARVTEISDPAVNFKAGPDFMASITVSQNDTTYAAGPQFFGTINMGYVSIHEFGQLIHRFFSSQAVVGITDTKHLYGGIAIGYMDNFEPEGKNTVSVGFDLKIKSDAYFFNEKLSFYFRGGLGFYTNNIFDVFVTDNSTYLHGAVGTAYRLQ